MLPFGIQDFETLRRGGYIYVDKTQSIAGLIGGAKYNFLSRPHKFGKSLLVSTLKALFEGKKDLFEGLWIADQHDFKPRPVIHLDFSRLNLYDKPLEAALLERLHWIAQSQSLTLKSSFSRDALEELILALSQSEPVVLLIDDCDKPIGKYLNDPAKERANLETLSNFLGLIKALDAHLHLVLLTGVGKFGKTNLFGELNSFYDLSLDPGSATLLGFTEEEIEASFAAHLDHAAEKLGLGLTKLWEGLRTWYQGYSWDAQQPVFCPFTLLAFFKNPSFKDHWYQTTAPAFILKLIKEQALDPLDLEHLPTSEHLIACAHLERPEIAPLMFQQGYLTLHGARPGPGGLRYQLGYPNQEVRQAFSRQLLNEYLEQSESHTHSLILDLQEALAQQNWPFFFEEVNHTLAGISYLFFEPYQGYLHGLIHLMLVSTGYPVDSQPWGSNGFAQTVVETPSHIFIFAFKNQGTPTEALHQLVEREPDAKPITYLGVVFDTQQKQVGAWEVEGEIYSEST